MASLNSNYLLAVESAISGGSIALFNGADFVSGTSGGGSVSRAEDLLPRIIDLLHDAGVERDEIIRIAISLGPGSYTGLRIGIATVMGLCRGLGIDYFGVPLFDAIEDFYQHRPSVVALPMGRSDVCVSEAGTGNARVTSYDDLKAELDREPDIHIYAHSDLVQCLSGVRADVVDIGTNLARSIGVAAIGRPPSTNLEPIYIQNPRFGQ